MICPICIKQIQIEEVLVSRTTDPSQDDQYENMYFCDTCKEGFPDFNDLDEMGDEYGN